MGTRDVLALFHRQWVARRQPWKVPWGLLPLSPPLRGSPLSRHKQSREQCAQHRSAVWMNKGSQTVSPSLNARHVLLWSASQMGTCKLSHWPNTWHHLTHHRLVFYSIPVSFLLPLQVPSFQPVNLQLNPWAIIPLPSAQNCDLQILIFPGSDFLRVHTKDIHYNISCNCLSGTEEG